jgi:hypothetical protein
MLGAERVVAKIGKSGLEDLHQGLKDGILLCELSNLLLPGSVGRINNPPKNVLQERENVEMFIAALEKHLLRPEERCTPADLHSGRDLISVVNCLVALYRITTTGKGKFEPDRESLNKPINEPVDAGPAVNKARSPLTRRGFFGMSAELQQHIESKNDPVRSAAALSWVEQMVVGQVDEQHTKVKDLSDLIDGVVLCTLINVIWPNSIPKFHTKSKIPMMHRENILFYLGACRALGVSPSELFSPTDLTEMKYPPGVIDNIFALARMAALRPNYQGPVLEVTRGRVRIRSSPQGPVQPPPLPEQQASSSTPLTANSQPTATTAITTPSPSPVKATPPPSVTLPSALIDKQPPKSNIGTYALLGLSVLVGLAAFLYFKFSI